MWRRILAYFLFGLGFLTLTFFKHYTGQLIPYPFLFWLIGLALFAGGFLFLRYTPDGKELEMRKKLVNVYHRSCNADSLARGSPTAEMSLLPSQEG